MDLDTMYLIVKHHWIDGQWPEDFQDIKTSYIGIFDSKYKAQQILKAMPLKGEEYSEKSDNPEEVRRFRNWEDDDRIRAEYIMYVIEEVNHF